MRAILAIWIAVTVSFLILRLLPGGPVALMLEGVNDPAIEARLMEQFGLDQSVIVQYFSFLWQLVQGNFGTSFYTLAPVQDILLSRLPWTLLLTGVAFITTVIIGVPLGVYASVKKDGWQDQLLRFGGMAGQALFVPAIAVLLLVVFALNLGWAPIGGAIDSEATGFWPQLGSVIRHMALPALTLAFISLGPYALTVRTNMLQILGSDYIRSSKSRGLTRNTIIWKHALRNAIIPAVTLAGIQLGSLVGGAVLTETVFAYPGIGRLIYDSVLRQDFPVLQGAFILLAVTVVLANFLTDIVVLGLDPKLRVRK